MKITWIEHISIKQLIKLEQKPDGKPQNLFELFGNVQHEKIIQEPANKSEQWLREQKQLTDEIIEKHFIAKPLNQREIELLIDAIEEYCQPEDEQFTEELYSKFKGVAKQIAIEYIKPLQLNQTTLYALIDQLTKKLEKRNAKHIEESNKEAMRQSIRLKGITGEYTKAQVEDILQSLEKMWAIPQENNEPYFEDERAEQEEHYPVYDFPLMITKQAIRFWQVEEEKLDIQLAEKLQQIAQTITENVGRLPFNGQLTLPEYSEWIEDKFPDVIEKIPNHYALANQYIAWHNSQISLILYAHQEDNGLPYEITLAAMDYQAFMPIYEAYETLKR